VRIISCSLENFASYKELNFDFSDQGLTLIQGATGSGKSTLCDVIPWVLFGKTAKGGAVDEVLSWPGNEVIDAMLFLELPSGHIQIGRQRGPKPKDNDLYYIDGITKTPVRGKDLNDTQKLINSLLGIDADLYLAGAYFHEFSQTAQFFSTTAKNRRVICEQLVDLSLAKKLKERLIEKCKSVNTELNEVQQSQRELDSNLTMLKRLQEQEKTKASDWQIQHDKTQKYVISCYDKFEANRKKTISKKCTTCGTQLEHPHEVVDSSTNPHLARLAELETEQNPYQGSVKDFSKEIKNNVDDTDMLEARAKDIKLELDDLELLQDVVSDYRSTSIINTIQGLEDSTNNLLSKHFDAEIKVSFSVEDADKLDVTIQKDGNVASFTQLSKGQRQILKLCFGLSVMQSVANHHGVKFDQIFLDEALDGLDDSMKLKALYMLRTIGQDYSSVFLVEHSETVKAMIDNKYQVELVNGESQICQL